MSAVDIIKTTPITNFTKVLENSYYLNVSVYDYCDEYSKHRFLN